MESLFLKIFNMSITASYVFAVVYLVRLLLKRGARKYAYILWAVVFIRLVCPMTMESFVSFIPKRSANVISRIEKVEQKFQIEENIIQKTQPNSYVNIPIEKERAKVDPLSELIGTLTLIWICGVIGLFGYSIWSYIRFKKQISTATLIERRIYESDRIRTPFVLGLINPKIYVPIGLNENEYEYILSHERIHIKRMDYIIKPVYFWAVAIHWFNPLMWLSYHLMVKDMEMSCDERVMNNINGNCKKDYAKLLLEMASKQSGIVSPIAFGENSTRSRIKNILKYRKPRVIIGVIASVVIFITAVGLVTNPVERKSAKLSFGIDEILDDLKMDEEAILLHNEKSGFLIKGETVAGYIESEKEAIHEKLESDSENMGSKMTVAYYRGGNLLCMDFYEDKMLEVRYKDEIGSFICPKEVYEEMFLRWGVVSSILPQPYIDMIMYPADRVMESGYDYPHYGREIYSFDIGKVYYYVYRHKNKDKYYLESPYMFIKEIPKALYEKGRDYSNGIYEIDVQLENIEIGEEDFGKASEMVEDGLKAIMEIGVYSNKGIYISEGSDHIEEIIKYGGEDALNYMLSQFKGGNAKGLRGEIMMHICKEILGNRNNVESNNLTAEDWYEELQIKEVVKLPDFNFSDENEMWKRLYDSVMEQEERHENTFMIPAIRLYGNNKEWDKDRYFINLRVEFYQLYDDVLYPMGGSIVPVAITYNVDDELNYSLVEYERAKDGADFKKSIEDFCVTPKWGKELEGIAERMIEEYSYTDDMEDKLMKNLKEHLLKHGKKGISLKVDHYDGESELIPLT